jgi:hypothetical protein
MASVCYHLVFGDDQGTRDDIPVPAGTAGFFRALFPNPATRSHICSVFVI